MRIVIKEL